MTPWPLTLKINRVPDSPKDYVCIKFCHNPLKVVDSKVFTRMLCGKNLIRWPWPLTLKINRFQTLLRTKLVPSLVKIHWRMLILVFTRMLCGKSLTQWPWKSIGIQTLLKTKYVPSLVKIHWRMLILECSQGCYRRTDDEGRMAVLLYPFETSLARG